MATDHKLIPEGDLCKSVAADVSPLRFHFGIEEIMEPTHIGCYDNSSFAEASEGVPEISPGLRRDAGRYPGNPSPKLSPTLKRLRNVRVETSAGFEP